MRKLLLTSVFAFAAFALSPPAKADVVLGGQTWTGTGATLSLTPTVPGGNQPQNAPCLICGENQPQQPAGFGYNDFQNGGNLTSVTAFSDQGNGGRNTLADNTFNNTATGGYQIGNGSLFLAFLLAHGATPGSLGFSIGLDANDNNNPQTLNAFYFLDLTTHTVLASFTGGTTGNIATQNNGTGFPDYTLTGFTLNGINAGDEIIFAARMTGLNDGPDSFFLEPAPVAAVPGPVVGAGVPGVLSAFAIFALGWYRKRRRVVAG